MATNSVQLHQSYATMAQNLKADAVKAWLGANGQNGSQKVKFNTRLLQINPETSGVRLPGVPIQNKKFFDGKSANETARQVFLRFILKECVASSKEDLPDVVKHAMKLDGGRYERHDWDEGNSRPLTARRMKFVMAAIDKYKKGLQVVADIHQEGRVRNGTQALYRAYESLFKGVSEELYEKLTSGGDDSHNLTFALYQKLGRIEGEAEKKAWFSELNKSYARNPNGQLVDDPKNNRTYFQ